MDCFFVVLKCCVCDFFRTFRFSRFLHVSFFKSSTFRFAGFTSSKEDVARQKKDIIQNEKEVYESSKQQIIDEDVHFHLIYKNRNGKIVSEIQISPRDLLGF